MFETLSLYALQHYWWIIISLLGGVLVFLLFVQGGQTLIYTIGKNSWWTNTYSEFAWTKMGIHLYNPSGIWWRIFSPSFPLFYSTSFGGAYWVWWLFCFVLFHSGYFIWIPKQACIYGKKFYEILLLINGFGGTLLLERLLPQCLPAQSFVIDFRNITNEESSLVISYGEQLHTALEAVLDWRNLMLGLAVFFWLAF